MRALLPLLPLLSLGANLLLGWRTWSAYTRDQPPPAATSVPVPTAPRPAPPPPPLGQQIESDDPATFVARLREIGLPRSLLHAVVSRRLGDQFSARMAALHTENASDEYWTANRVSTPEQARQYFAARADHMLQLQALLGPDYDLTPLRIAEATRRYGPLDAAKIPSLEGIINDYQAMLISYRTTMIRLPGDEDAMALLAREQQADLASLLSPSELFEYNLRNDDAATKLRPKLALLNVSEAEFRLIYPLWAELETAYPSGSYVDLTGQTPDAGAAARADLIARASNLLGPDRAAELAQALNPRASIENNFAAGAGLPASTAAVLYDSRIAAMTLLQSSPANDTPEERTTRQQQAQALIDQVNAVLTEEQAKRFESSNGQWLQGLRRVAAPPPGPPAAPTPPTGG